MPTHAYRGAVTTTGSSEAIRFERALFRQNPEFCQKASIEAHVIGRGMLLVHVLDDVPELEQGEHGDPVVGAFLAFMERDIANNPERIEPLLASQVARAVELTRDVVVGDDDEIPDDISL